MNPVVAFITVSAPCSAVFLAFEACYIVGVPYIGGVS